METEKTKPKQTPVAYHTESRQTCPPFEQEIVLQCAVHVATCLFLVNSLIMLLHLSVLNTV